jgi:hypothetical protein
MDFFTVPTATLRILYVWFIIHHGRRRILHFNVTERPRPPWVIQQLRESFSYETAPFYLVFDRDSIFAGNVVSMVRALGIEPKRIAYRSPWQDSVAERWIGSRRRELLDRIVILHEGQLRRLLREYVDYYSRDRCHLGLEKDAPDLRSAQRRPSRRARVVSLPRGGRAPSPLRLARRCVTGTWNSVRSRQGSVVWDLRMTPCHGGHRLYGKRILARRAAEARICHRGSLHRRNLSPPGQGRAPDGYWRRTVFVDTSSLGREEFTVPR